VLLRWKTVSRVHDANSITIDLFEDDVVARAAIAGARVCCGHARKLNSPLSQMFG
jgi:hypothetical protein